MIKSYFVCEALHAPLNLVKSFHADHAIASRVNKPQELKFKPRTPSDNYFGVLSSDCHRYLLAIVR